MNKISKFFSSLKSLLIIAVLCIMQTVVFAQDKSADLNVNVTKGGGNWYASPWVWVIGGAIFLLLLVALLRGNSNKN
ncbi:MAG: hypothetical protein H0W12_00870 [Chitinophagaceae bacterium]|nr:hypothetical protein [Chitinophagaceae bacterium]